MSTWFETLAITSAGMLMDAGFWVVVSLAVAGLLHEFVDTGAVRRLMHRAGMRSVLGAMGLGAMLPICSCGVVPLSVGFHLGGVRLAAVLAFTAATPVINPAAIILSLAFLGPELTAAYLLFGLAAPLLVGYLTERVAPAANTAAAMSLQQHCCSAASGCAALSRRSRLRRAMRWAFLDLGPTLGLYLAAGVLLAALLMVLVPSDWFTDYLGTTAPLGGLLLVALFGAVIYVCAVAHIPMVAALLAAGAGPGAAIVFLVTGAVTNLPELMALGRVLGARTVLVYTGSLVLLSIVAGWVVNVWLADYQPMLDPQSSMLWSDLAARVTPVIPQSLALGSAVLLGLLAVAGLAQRILRRRDNADVPLKVET
ncbi:MAG: permease [Thiogranum sp.]|nr:permease [Thiogranum sp.]